MIPKSKTSNIFPAIIAKISKILRAEDKIIQDKYRMHEVSLACLKHVLFAP
jgi:hypothetical protein